MKTKAYVFLATCNLLAVALFLMNNQYMRGTYREHVAAQARLDGESLYFHYLKDHKITIPTEHQPRSDKVTSLERDLNLWLEDYITLYPACVTLVLPLIFFGFFLLRDRFRKRKQNNAA